MDHGHHIRGTNELVRGLRPIWELFNENLYWTILKWSWAIQNPPIARLRCKVRMRKMHFFVAIDIVRLWCSCNQRKKFELSEKLVFGGGRFLPARIRVPTTCICANENVYGAMETLFILVQWSINLIRKAKSHYFLFTNYPSFGILWYFEWDGIWYLVFYSLDRETLVRHRIRHISFHLFAVFFQDPTRPAFRPICSEKTCSSVAMVHIFQWNPNRRCFPFFVRFNFATSDFPVARVFCILYTFNFDRRASTNSTRKMKIDICRINKKKKSDVS